MALPRRFADLLSPIGRRLLGGSVERSSADRLWTFPEAIDPVRARDCLRALDAELAPHLSHIVRGSRTYQPIVNGQVRPMPFDSGFWIESKDPSSAGALALERVGIMDLMGSDSLRTFVEHATGLSLSATPGVIEASAYGSGDYAAPHLDVHDDGRDHLRVVLSFANDAVAEQWLIHESGGRFNARVDVARPASLTLILAPLWHQVTPLVALPGRDREALRWVMVASFELERSDLTSDPREWTLASGVRLQWNGTDLVLRRPGSADFRAIDPEFVPLLDIFASPHTISDGTSRFLTRYGDHTCDPAVAEAVQRFTEQLCEGGVLTTTGALEATANDQP